MNKWKPIILVFVIILVFNILVNTNILSSTTNMFNFNIKSIFELVLIVASILVAIRIINRKDTKK